MCRWRVGRWLLWLSDPVGSRRPPPAPPLRADEAYLLLWCADAHHVLPVVTRNLCSATSSHGLPRIIASTGPHGARDGLRSFLAQAETQLQRRKILSVLIERQTEDLGRALAGSGLPAVLLKGADFAARLYPAAGLRYYRDVDVLTEPSAIASAGRLMERMGYVRVRLPFNRRTAEPQEVVWRHRGGQGALVEIHGDLVHLPALRRRTSVGLSDLELEPAPAGSLLPMRASPTSLLLVAAVHAGMSHTFGRLQALCDVVQAARCAAGPVSVERMAQMAARTGSGRVVATALLLSRAAFGEARCASLMAELEACGMHRGQAAPVPPGAWLPMVTPWMIARPNSPAQRLAREILRCVFSYL